MRREGFLSLLESQAWHTLSAVLSFTSRDGSRRFSLEQLATAIGQPREEAGRRLAALAQIDWKGNPLAVPERDPAGEVCGATLAPVERLALPGIPAEPLPGLEVPEQRPNFPPGLIDQLAILGLNPAQIDRLAQRFPEADVRRQLEWLPARGARNPAALLIRAIEQQWEEPKEHR